MPCLIVRTLSRWGREANSVYGEEWNGNQVGVLHHGHHWKMPVDPFRQPGNPDARTFAAGWREVFKKFDVIPNRKTDTNNHGPFR